MELTISEKRQARFWKHVDKTNGCWLWMKGRDKDGYGKVTLNGLWLRAHRVSWALTKGKLTNLKFKMPDLFVCHECDNPPCVNPDHLFLGTVTDNARDSIRKGRSSCEHLRVFWKENKKGEANACSKLKNEDVISIRRLSSENGLSQRKIAKCFGVSQALVGYILRGRNWTHV